MNHRPMDTKDCLVTARTLLPIISRNYQVVYRILLLPTAPKVMVQENLISAVRTTYTMTVTSCSLQCAGMAHPLSATTNAGEHFRQYRLHGGSPKKISCRACRMSMS